MKLQQGSSGLDVLGNVLTSGIDAARQIQLARFGVSQPTPNTSAPNGAPSLAGEGAYGLPFGMSPLMAVGALALVGLLVWKLAK